MPRTFIITIQGQVQGVGFRPFVFSLAKKYNLKGQVFNNEIGVVIFLNASEEKASSFLKELLQNPPIVSVIQNHTLRESQHQNFEDFKIITSKNNKQINLPLTPDFAICEDCKAEIQDPKNRRFQYAFTTCVKCGPRYSITTEFPFERANTALVSFKMCSTCEKEYKNPADRRFHSQTNSCSECGIKMNLEDSEGRIIEHNQQEVLTRTAQYISEGKIVAIKNTNGYLLCCDANNKETVQLLRKRKKRMAKPFALLYPSLNLAKNHFDISEKEEIVLTSSVAPIVILPIQKNLENVAVETIAPNLNHLGVMLPSSALLQLVMNKIGTPIVATSGNIHGSPIISENNEARRSLKKVADFILHHNLEIQFPQDDSVVKFMGEQQIILRRSRGLAPNYLESNLKSKEQVLAMGAHLKCTFSFVPNSNIYISQYFGNLDNYEVSESFKKTIQKFTKVFETTPKTILVDAHPQYQSTIIGRELADDWNAEVKEIQHHKTHFASVLAEHNLFTNEEIILGVVWDGTGWGEDNAIWGGEFFMYHNHQMERLAHFEYFDWIAGDKMAKEPRLSLLSLTSEENRESIQHKFSETEWKVYLKLLKNNPLKTSSVGRLFDAVASLLEITDYNTFEGEAAMRLEAVASSYKGENFIDFLESENYSNMADGNTGIPSKKMIENIRKSLSENTSKEKIAASFIFTMAKSIIQLAKNRDINTIACSGGVFQNSLLLKLLKLLTGKHSLLLKLNRKLSCNDENISFGQLQYYLNITLFEIEQ